MATIGMARCAGWPHLSSPGWLQGRINLAATGIGELCVSRRSSAHRRPNLVQPGCTRRDRDQSIHDRGCGEGWADRIGKTGVLACDDQVAYVGHYERAADAGASGPDRSPALGSPRSASGGRNNAALRNPRATLTRCVHSGRFLEIVADCGGIRHDLIMARAPLNLA